MASQPLTVREILAILPETPRLIATLTAGLKPIQLHASPTPDAWSISDVLAHLRACHDVLGGSILRILAEDARRAAFARRMGADRDRDGARRQDLQAERPFLRRLDGQP